MCEFYQKQCKKGLPRCSPYYIFDEVKESTLTLRSNPLRYKGVISIQSITGNIAALGCSNSAKKNHKLPSILRGNDKALFPVWPTNQIMALKPPTVKTYHKTETI